MEIGVCSVHYPQAHHLSLTHTHTDTHPVIISNPIISGSQSAMSVSPFVATLSGNDDEAAADSVDDGIDTAAADGCCFSANAMAGGASAFVASLVLATATLSSNGASAAFAIGKSIFDFRRMPFVMALDTRIIKIKLIGFSGNIMSRFFALTILCVRVRQALSLSLPLSLQINGDNKIKWLEYKSNSTFPIKLYAFSAPNTCVFIGTHSHASNISIFYCCIRLGHSSIGHFTFLWWCWRRLQYLFRCIAGAVRVHAQHFHLHRVSRLCAFHREKNAIIITIHM